LDHPECSRPPGERPARRVPKSARSSAVQSLLSCLVRRFIPFNCQEDWYDGRFVWHLRAHQLLVLLQLSRRLSASHRVLDEQPGQSRSTVFQHDHRFVDCDNGTVTDTLTGLIWLKNASCFGETGWVTANAAAAGLFEPQCGLTDGSRRGDWRLPTKEEWETILEPDCSLNPRIAGNDSPDPGCYSGTPWASGVWPDAYWSSTTAGNYPHYPPWPGVWTADLDHGHIDVTGKVALFYVWPVRGGQ